MLRKQTEWRPVKGYEDRYEVRSDGVIRSMRRPVIRFGKRYCNTPKVLAQTDHHGTMWVQFCYEKKSHWRSVARVVAEAFVENPSGYQYVGFKDGDPYNLEASNLFWKETKNSYGN